MPKIIVNAFLTMDGVMQAPGGPDEDPEGGFSHGGWQGPYSDPVMGRLVTEGLADADGFLLGRKTYDIFSNYWPKVTDPDNPIATALNSRPKYVVSRTLEQVAWNNSRLVKGDLLSELRGLRAHAGRTLQTWGSTQLLQALLENDLIDEYRLFIFPVMLGSGKRLFGSGTVPMALKPMESVTSDKGATYLRLARNGKPEYGQIERQVAAKLEPTTPGAFAITPFGPPAIGRRRPVATAPGTGRSHRVLADSKAARWPSKR